MVDQTRYERDEWRSSMDSGGGDDAAAFGACEACAGAVPGVLPANAHPFGGGLENGSSRNAAFPTFCRVDYRRAGPWNRDGVHGGDGVDAISCGLADTVLCGGSRAGFAGDVLQAVSCEVQA